jgi:hypothetical protein
MIRVEDPWSMTVYRNYYRAAQRGDPVPSRDRLVEMLGECSLGTVSNVDAKLIEAGLIRVETFQRSRRIYVVEIDSWTAMPPNTDPHWRKRAEHAGRTKGGRVIQSQMVRG